MKKFAIYLFTAFLSVVCFSTLSSCSDDDGIVDYEGKPYLKYKLEVDEDFLSFYDVTITYKTPDGNNEYSEQLSNQTWQQRFDCQNIDTYVYYFIVTAKAKSNIPDTSTKTRYYLNYAYGVHWYQKSGGAKSYTQEGGTPVTRADIQNYIEEHPVIEICNITKKPGMDE